MNAELFFLDEKDNVGITFSDLKTDEAASAGQREIQILNDIPKGHKVAVKEIGKGEAVVKYGAVIGYAMKGIQVGEHVHIHNIKTGLSEQTEYKYEPEKDLSDISPIASVPLLYKRRNGKAGIRNELWIIPTVGCVNGTAQRILQDFLMKKDRDGLTGVDGVYCFTHPYGCSQLGGDHERTRSFLQNMALHPNAGGVLILGLGCENNQVQAFQETMPEQPDSERIRYLISQDVEDEIEAGIACLEELYSTASQDKRSEGSWEDLIIGLECGGSDAFSGITANPLIGSVSDRVIKSGGTAVLTEVPEMFGAENVLMKQCADKRIFEMTKDMVESYKKYYRDHNQPVYENPSPGNKAGGITTLEDKSLGCIRKSGKSEIRDVVKMGGMVSKKGLNLLYAPGNDIVATTALGTSGCQLVLFSTGRGTPLGGFIPTLKIASNTALAEHKKKWIDFNAGIIGDGTSDMAEASELLLDKILKIVNGEQTAAEKSGIREIAIFKDGVTL